MLESLLYSALIGALAGWLGGNIMKGSGFGLLGNIIVGILGAIVGSFLLGGFVTGLVGGGMLGDILSATVGAVILLFVIGLIKGKS